MSYAFHFTASMQEEFKKTVEELLRSTTRSLVVATGLIYGIWLILTVGSHPRTVALHLPISVVLFTLCGVVLLILPRRMLLAQIIWHVGLLLTVTLAANTFRIPWIGFLNVLIPLMGAITIGWPAAISLSVLVWGSFWLWLPSMRSPQVLWGITGISACAGGLGWLATRALLTVARWSLFTYEQMREKMEEARDQQLHLREVETDLIHANQELARLSDYLGALNQIAEEARQAKENFVASVSHELRTPLNMILGFSEVITQSPELYGTRLPPALMADMRAIYRNSQHLSQLVDDVLSLSKVDANRVVLNKAWVQLGDVVDEAAGVMRPLIESKGLMLNTGAMPSVEIFCDETRIRQVIINLLNNAARFTERGGISIETNLEPESVVVAVRDTGPGIAPEAQALIFEPFQQASPTIHKEYGGTGLGLAICKRFVEMHDGEMWLESDVGVGTSFYFRLPITSRVPISIINAQDAKRWFNPYKPYEPRTRPFRAPNLPPTTRYIVVDEENIIGHLLEHQDGNSEIVALNGPDDVRVALSKGPVQAVIVNLPRIEAQPYIDVVNANTQYKTPILTFWMPGDNAVIRKMGVRQYLVKPVRKQALIDALHQLDMPIQHILIVDDDAEVHQLFSRMFAASDLPYTMLWATSGKEALEILRERDVDVLLLDLLMPEMSGYEMLEIKQREPGMAGIPVIVISAEDPDIRPPSSSEIHISQPGGLSTHDLMRCITKTTQALAPESQTDDSTYPETPHD